MANEQNHIFRYHKDEKKKSIAFNAETINEKEELGEANNEGMTLITRGVSQMLWQRRQWPQYEVKRLQ